MNGDIVKNIKTCSNCGKTSDWGEWGGIYSPTTICVKCYFKMYGIPTEHLSFGKEGEIE